MEGIMNRFMEERWSWIDGTHQMRLGVIDSVSDAELAFNPGGLCMTLGALCREMGEVEYSYVQSLKTFKQDWTYRKTEAGMDSSIAQLKTWYQALDDEMKATVAALSDADLQKNLERFSGFSVPVEMQLDIYIQAMLIFLGKATIYLRAMNKSLPPSMQEYIG
jgi:hypothetical protein